MTTDQLMSVLATILGSNALSAWVAAKYTSRKTNAEAAATAAGEWQKLYLQQRTENDELRSRTIHLEQEVRRLEDENDVLRRRLSDLEERLAELERRSEG
jgi:cell division protein FtsB